MRFMRDWSRRRIGKGAEGSGGLVDITLTRGWLDDLTISLDTSMVGLPLSSSPRRERAYHQLVQYNRNSASRIVLCASPGFRRLDLLGCPEGYHAGRGGYDPRIATGCQ